MTAASERWERLSRPRIYHQSGRFLGDNPHLSVEDWRTIWLAWQGFQHTVHLVVEAAEARSGKHAP